MCGMPAASREISAASVRPASRTGAARAARGQQTAASASRRRIPAPRLEWDPRTRNKAPRRRARQVDLTGRPGYSGRVSPAWRGPMPNVPLGHGSSRDDPGSTVPARDLERDAMIGRQVGSYRIAKLLGEGGMGAVYLGEHPAIGSTVAIKMLHAQYAAKPTIVERFFNA